MKLLAFSLLASGVLSMSYLQAADVGFVEEFALAKDRAEALKKLIPGTEDQFYYHALHYLNTEQFAKASALFKPWYDRFGQSARLTEAQTRHALLTYEKNPKASLDYFRNRLGLRFDHQRIVQGGSPSLPTSLDPKAISRETLASRAAQRWNQGTDDYEDAALDWLVSDKLDSNLRRHLLGRLPRPDFADLPRLVADDLNTLHSAGFGSFNVHRLMTLAQLEELLNLKPELLNQTNFVNAYIARLHPSDDSDFRRDPAQMKAYLDRLLSFVRRLSPAHNSLKAHVIFQRLTLDISMGIYDKALFVEYLKLPRFQPYMARPMLENAELRRLTADLNANWTPATMLPIVSHDEKLVRDYLKHFLLDAASPKEFEPYINDQYLQRLFAEVKIENGLGEPETWAASFSPEEFRALKDRIDIDFSPAAKTSFGADEAVSLDLFVKNVPTLMVKVFEVNALNYYRTQRREVDTAINLDGLIANSEQSYNYAETPFRRVGRKFDFAQLSKPGVYVVDFIGAGRSSRALIKKGRLRPVVGSSTAGQRLTIVDDADKPVANATVWLGGQEYKCDDKGVVIVPFSTAPGRQPIVISKGDFASLDYLQHQAEGYALSAGIHVDRESLLTQRMASVLVRPGLKLNGVPVSVKLLDEAKLTIVATDLDGIATSTEVPEFKLFEDRESVLEFRVPPRLATLSVTLRAKVKSLSLGKDVELSASQSFGLNGIDRTDKIEDLHLAKFGADFAVELLGRTGEPKADRPVRFSIKHREFKEAVDVLLKSDARGRIVLGPLADIASVTASGPEGTSHTWNLPLDRHTYRHVVHAKLGETIALPHLGGSAKAARDEFALFEMRGSAIAFDRFDAISINDGMIELRGLPAGDFDLWLKRTGERIRVRVVDGVVEAGWVLGRLRFLQLPLLKPAQIAGIAADADTVMIKLRDYSKFTRVHVYATRYLPAFDGYSDLAKVRDIELAGTYPIGAESIYLAGRNIGDEYRYVLDRRNQKHYPGNMLERPSLLLNPWVLRSTETGEQIAKDGEDYKKVLKESGGGLIRGNEVTRDNVNRQGQIHPEGGGDFADLDYLYDASAVLLNLVPDKDGFIRIARKDLGAHAMIHVLAVDPVNTTARSVSLPEQKADFVDLRLRNGLDPKLHFTQQKQADTLTPGKPFVLADAAASRFEAYDSLAKVYALYTTLSHDPKLAEFSFVLNWPKLKLEEKKTFYSKYACHELSFFIAKKDPEFFNAVVKPYLSNKRDKTFMDHWLIGDDLSSYLQPWQHARLNSVERILLAQRLAGEPGRTSRHLADLLKLHPADAERERFLFETALKNGDLGSDKGAYFKDVLVQLRQKQDVAIRGYVEAQAFDNKPASGPAGMAMDAAAAKAPPASGGFRGRGTSDPLKKSSADSRDGSSRKDADKEHKEALQDVKRDELSFFDEDRQKTEAPSRLYRRIDPTNELAENNYYKLPIAQQLAALVNVSAFWVDYSKHDGKGPFLSKHLADASRNFTEMMFALAVIDLPFEAGKSDVKFDGGKMTYTPAGTVLAFHEEVKPVAGIDSKVQILVSQNFYRAGDRYRDEAGERLDKFVTAEFVIHTVYGCQVVVTNPTPSRQRLSVLLQIPVGAIAVANGQPTKTVMLDLEPYRTQIVDMQFYFPKSGSFAHFPVHVAKGETLVAAAAPFVFNVVDKPTKLDTESWEYVSQNGTDEQVTAYLNRENVSSLDLDKIAFRMRDKAFFESVLTLLKGRHAWNATLWSYALFHKDSAAAREYMAHVDSVVNEAGGPIDSPLLVVDPISRHQYEHLEYKPLVNARAHSLGHVRQIVNGAFHEQYHRFLKMMTYRTKLTDDDQLAVTYYLLLQDRVEEALESFAKVNVANVPERMQYDYCAAYLDLFNEAPAKARAVAIKYANHPVDRWRNAFAAIANQLDEIEGKANKLADKDDQAQQQAKLAALEPAADFTIDAKTINLSYRNVESVRINYYLMDVELLFSRNPFVQQSGGQFSMIRPNETAVVKLAKDKDKLAIPLPENLAKKNVLVEIVSAGKTVSHPYYANAMTVRMSENQGQLQVTDAATGKALAKAYVKVYARLADNSVKFHKDGYTDLRGKFDYATVSTPEKSGVARFGILVLSEGQGALIREANPPQR